MFTFKKYSYPHFHDLLEFFHFFCTSCSTSSYPHLRNTLTHLSLLPGSYLAADSGVHLLPGTGEDSATAAEQSAETLHPGEEGLELS